MPVRIELPESAWDALLDQALREWRTPKQQAEFLILKALGWELPPAPSKTRTEKASVIGVTAGEEIKR